MNVGNKSDSQNRNLLGLKEARDSELRSNYNVAPERSKNQLTVSGIPLQALVSELAPQKKYNTVDYEYLQQLEDTHKRAELIRKVELERELREFRKAKQLNRVITDAPQSTIVKPTIAKSISSIIKIKPKKP